MEAAKYVSELVEKARVAQAVIENYTQEQVDALCKAMAKAIFDNAEPLARMAVDETGMGVYEDKVNKNKGKARVIWSDMKGGKSVGIIRQLPELGLTEVAKPMALWAAIHPHHQPHRHPHVQRHVRPEGPQCHHRWASPPVQEVLHPGLRADAGGHREAGCSR